MTQPRTGPGSGPDPESAGSTSGSTATRMSSSTASVPQQMGQQQGRTAYGEDSAEQALPGDRVLASAAKASWATVLVGALCMIGLGIVILVWPHATLAVVAILVGAALLVSGIVKLYEGFTDRSESGGMRVAYVVIGLLAVLAGIYCIRHHALSLFLVAFVTGVYFIAQGIADIGVSVAAAGVPGRGVRAVLGIFSLGAGIVIVAWPGPSLVILLTIFAAWLLFYGLVLGWLSFSLRRAGKQAEKRVMATPAPAI